MAYNTKEKLNKFMREYYKKGSEQKKSRVRTQTRRIYGKTPKGYERHHIDYESPHNFILIPIKEHKEIHKK